MKKNKVKFPDIFKRKRIFGFILCIALGLIICGLVVKQYINPKVHYVGDEECQLLVHAEQTTGWGVTYGLPISSTMVADILLKGPDYEDFKNRVQNAPSFVVPDISPRAYYSIVNAVEEMNLEDLITDNLIVMYAGTARNKFSHTINPIGVLLEKSNNAIKCLLSYPLQLSFLYEEKGNYRERYFKVLVTLSGNPPASLIIENVELTPHELDLSIKPGFPTL